MRTGRLRELLKTKNFRELQTKKKSLATGLEPQGFGHIIFHTIEPERAQGYCTVKPARTNNVLPFQTDLNQQCLDAIEHALSTVAGHIGHDERWKLVKSLKNSLPEHIHEPIKDLLADARHRLADRDKCLTHEQASVEIDKEFENPNGDFGLSMFYSVIKELNGTITSMDKAAIEAIAGEPEYPSIVEEEEETAFGRYLGEKSNLKKANEKAGLLPEHKEKLKTVLVAKDETPASSYLDRKQISLSGKAITSGGNIYAFLDNALTYERDVIDLDNVTNCQTIWPSKNKGGQDKFFEKGLSTKGQFYLAGKLTAESDTVFYVEGVADSETVQETLGCPAIAAMSCHQFWPVLVSMTESHSALTEKPWAINRSNGRKHIVIADSCDAKQAAKLCEMVKDLRDCYIDVRLMIVPDPEGKGNRDPNDLVLEEGEDALRALLTPTLAGQVFPPDIDPIVVEPDWKEALAANCTEFNKEHAITLVGGKARVMRREDEGYSFTDIKQKSLVFDSQKIQIDAKGRKANVLEAWRHHANCRVYTGGIVFAPNQEGAKDRFNTWEGYAVEPMQNDGMLGRIYSHIKEVICAGKPELYEYLLNWIAYTFQYPERPAGAAIVVRGLKGSGKGTLGHFLKSIWGRHAFHIANATHLVGQFNPQLADCCLLFADEAFFAGDRKHEGILKALVTEPVMTVERKGIDPIQQKNYLKIYMSTNEDFAVPASRDERRYCVLDALDTFCETREYFNALNKDTKCREVQSAFLYAMLNRNIEGFHTGDIPDSVGLRAQRYHSMNSVQKWLVEAFIDGCFYGRRALLDERAKGDAGLEARLSLGDYWETQAGSTELHETSYIAWCNTHKIGEYHRAKLTTFGTYLGEVFTNSRDAGGRGRRGFIFGDLPDAVAKFEKYERVNIDELGAKKE